MWVRQMKLNLTQRVQARESPVIYPKGWPDFPINGLTFYQENIERIRSGLLLSDNDETITEAILVCEPDNPYSKSGTAVAVYLNALKVGYVPDESSAYFFKLLKGSGGIARAEARFYYSSDGYSSCRLDVNFPPSWEAPIQGIEPDYLEGDGTFSFRMRSGKFPINWEQVKALNPDIYIEVGDTYTGAGYLTMSDYGRSPYLDTDFQEVTAKPYESDDVLINRLLASVGGQAKVEFVLTRTSEKSHSTKLDLDVSKWRAANKSKPTKPKTPNSTFGVWSSPKKRRPKKSVWIKILFGKPKRKKSVWRGFFLGD